MDEDWNPSKSNADSMIRSRVNKKSTRERVVGGGEIKPGGVPGPSPPNTARREIGERGREAKWSFIDGWWWRRKNKNIPYTTIK